LTLDITFIVCYTYVKQWRKNLWKNQRLALNVKAQVMPTNTEGEINIGIPVLYVMAGRNNLTLNATKNG